MSAHILDCTEAEYHADPCETPSLSSSLATVLATRSPAHAYARHPRLGGGVEQVDPLARRVGNAVHSCVLGGGPPVVTLDFDSWRTKDSKSQRDEAVASHAIPLLAHEAAAIAPMIDVGRKAMARHGLVDGAAEQTIVWRDADVLCRSRLDYLIVTPDGATIVDLKTAASAKPEDMERAIAQHGYDIQAHAYRRAVEELHPHLAGRIQYVWLVIEKEPPFAAYVTGPGGDTDCLGAKRWEYARELWRTCLASNHWPGYEPYALGVPAWAMNRWLEKEEDEHDRKAL